jgi:flavodoxin
MSKTLIVYFSRTGRTRQIAEAMAGLLGADVGTVKDVANRSGIWGYLRCLREAMQQRVIETGPATKDPSDYDLIVLGTPVWGHNMCSPMRSYIVAQKERFRAIAVFCTQGGSGGSKVAGQIAELCGRRPLATLVLNASEIDKDQCTGKLNEFIKSLVPTQAV